MISLVLNPNIIDVTTPASAIPTESTFGAFDLSSQVMEVLVSPDEIY
jgi:hypothetical protein